MHWRQWQIGLSVVGLLAADALAGVEPGWAVETKISKKAKSGVATNVGGHMRFDKNCKAHGFPEVSIEEPPTHGSICAEKKMMKLVKFIDDPPKYPYCKGRMIEGLRIWYSSAAGFEGTEKFIYKIVYRDGSQQVRKVAVDVRWEDSPFLDRPRPKLDVTPQTPGDVPYCNPVVSGLPALHISSLDPPRRGL